MKALRAILATLFLCLALLSASLPSFMGFTPAAGVAEAFAYQHDPRINSKAMADIIVNPEAVYGFSPDPESERLGGFAAYDWTDPEVVERARQARLKYIATFTEMFRLWDGMKAEGKSAEEIARAVSRKRNEIRLASYAGNPEGLATVKQSNLQKYGQEEGPTPEQQYQRYGSWEAVTIKSFSSNSGMDACVGLYDMQYEHNAQVSEIVENPDILYTVEAGDYLCRLARKYYGEESAWQKIYELNREVIGDDLQLQPGDRLKILLP